MSFLLKGLAGNQGTCLRPIVTPGRAGEVASLCAADPIRRRGDGGYGGRHPARGPKRDRDQHDHGKRAGHRSHCRTGLRATGTMNCVHGEVGNLNSIKVHTHRWRQHRVAACQPRYGADTSRSLRRTTRRRSVPCGPFRARQGWHPPPPRRRRGEGRQSPIGTVTQGTPPSRPPYPAPLTPARPRTPSYATAPPARAAAPAARTPGTAAGPRRRRAPSPPCALRPRQHVRGLDTALPAAALAHRDEAPGPVRVVAQRQHQRKSSRSGMRP